MLPTVIISIGFFILFSIWLLLDNPKYRRILYFILLPVLVCMFLSAIWSYNNILGYPAKREPTGEFQVVSFIEQKNIVYIWIMLPEKTVPIALEVKATPELKQQLQLAKEYMQANIPVIGNFDHTGFKGGEFLKLRPDFRPHLQKN